MPEDEYECSECVYVLKDITLLIHNTLQFVHYRSWLAELSITEITSPKRTCILLYLFCRFVFVVPGVLADFLVGLNVRWKSLFRGAPPVDRLHEQTRRKHQNGRKNLLDWSNVLLR